VRIFRCACCQVQRNRCLGVWFFNPEELQEVPKMSAPTGRAELADLEVANRVMPLIPGSIALVTK
jgi:hypothetical protein